MRELSRFLCVVLAVTLLLCAAACEENTAKTDASSSSPVSSATSTVSIAGASEASSLTESEAASPSQNETVSTAGASSDVTASSAKATSSTQNSVPAVSLKAGDKVTFGHFEQDNNESNGKEAVEWEVLAVDGEYALLLSTNILAFRPFYYDMATGVTWEACSLRGWLNNNFLGDAFSADEQKQIRTTHLVNANSAAGVLGGNDTDDKVFVLSVDDVNAYLSTVEQWRGLASDTVRHGNWKVDDLEHLWWWLRTPGYGNKGETTNTYATVPGETVNLMGELVTTCSGVRPALWARLTSKTVSDRVPASAKSDPLKGVKVGDTVSFGMTASQTVTPAPDVPIRWKVLAVENGRALLLSEAVLLSDAMYGFEPYKGTYVSWSSSLLRFTMSDLWKSLFTAAEAARIAETQNGKNFDGTSVIDRFFALSNTEVQTYLPTEASRTAKDLKGNPASWWLRGTTAQGPYGFVDVSGAFAGEDTSSVRHGVRPAMWVTLN